MSFFTNFPLAVYKFGDENSFTLIQNISAYINIIDELRDDLSYYTTEFIQDYDRPDSFSFKLYDTTDFYWTFYYLNDDIRESGWPLPQNDLLPKAKLDYPHRTITTTGDISKTFLPGHTVTGSLSGTIGTVVKRYMDLGQIIVEPFSKVLSITLDNAGSGYLSAPTVTITTRSGDIGANASGVAQFSNNTITSIQVIPPVFNSATRINALLPVNAGSFEIGKEYKIVTTADDDGGATTDFALVGLLPEISTTVFTATGVGTGTGTAVQTEAQADISSLISGFIGASKGDLYRDPPKVVISEPNLAGGVQATATAVINISNNFNAGEIITPSINGVAQTADIVIVESEVAQFNSVHHYENAAGDFVDIGLAPSGTGTGAFPSLSGKTPVTYFERVTNKNDSLREINVLKPNIAAQVKTEFNKLLLSTG
tara:strand:- start:7977 stop:9257 length:1281 start_codon:yes stop_codon:yes gene_type:complete